MTVAIAVCLAAGFAAGLLLPAIQLPVAVDDGISILLCAMLFFVGLELGMKKGLRQSVKDLGLGFFALPALAAAGSVLGGLFTGMLLDLKDWQGAAVGAGFGWYSLSSVMLARYDSSLSAIAFLSNVIREVLAIIFIPIAARFIHPWAGIAAGGATSMDTTLPVIVKAAGADYAIQSFINGVILSVLAPAAITMILFFAGVN